MYERHRTNKLASFDLLAAIRTFTGKPDIAKFLMIAQ
jgi:hypothetical protein